MERGWRGWLAGELGSTVALSGGESRSCVQPRQGAQPGETQSLLCLMNPCRPPDGCSLFPAETEALGTVCAHRESQRAHCVLGIAQWPGLGTQRQGTELDQQVVGVGQRSRGIPGGGRQQAGPGEVQAAADLGGPACWWPPRSCGRSRPRRE